eukprot:1713430-Amphidinium_carterae.1
MPKSLSKLYWAKGTNVLDTWGGIDESHVCAIRILDVRILVHFLRTCYEIEDRIQMDGEHVRVRDHPNSKKLAEINNDLEGNVD